MCGYEDDHIFTGCASLVACAEPTREVYCDTAYAAYTYKYMYGENGKYSRGVFLLSRATSHTLSSQYVVKAL